MVQPGVSKGLGKVELRFIEDLLRFLIEFEKSSDKV